MVVLWWVGALADRRDRGQLLCFASYIGVAIIGVLLVATSGFPRASAVALLIVGKQVGGVLELLLWVVIADRFTAREARKLLPWVVAANGCGAALGAISVGPLAIFFGVTGPLGAALVLLVLVSGASQLLRYAPDKRVALLASRTRARGAKTGLSLLWQRPLAKWLAILVASAGVFAPIMYYLLGVSAASEYSSEVELAGFFGEFRAYVQVAALFAQITIAPWLSRRVGIGVLLVIAPVGALMVAMGVGWRDELMWIVAGQALTRILDTAIQNPAEQLIQNLLPQSVRGRVAGLVGGVAKRSGAILGGLAASLVIVWPTVFTLLLVVAAGVWLLVAIHLWRHFAEYAVTELATTSRAMDSHALALRFVSERDLLSLRKRLRSTDRREQSNALALLERLSQHAKVDAVEELLDAMTRCIKLAPELRLALRLRLGDGDSVSDKSCMRALKLLHSKQRQESELALEILGFVQLSPAQEEPARALASRSDSIAGQMFEARVESTSVLEALSALSALGHDAEIVHQLRYEIVHASRQNSQDSSEDLAERLLRSISHCPVASLQVAGLRSVLQAMKHAGHSAMGVLLRGRLDDLSRRWRHDSLPALREASLLAIESETMTDFQPWIAALADREESVRSRAESLLRGAGENALAALTLASQSGKRRIRMAAVEILADLRPSAGALDALLERELEEMVQCRQSAQALRQVPEAKLVRRRLIERIDEALEAALMALEARMSKAGIGEVAKRLARAGGERSRSRALEALDALLPRKISRTILGAMEGTTEGRLSVEQSIELQLQGRDVLTRDLLLHALGRQRADFRGSIATAALTAASVASPERLVRRIIGDHDSLLREVPTTLETIVALSDLALFAEMTTIQLEELAGVVEWEALAAGHTLMVQGEEATCMYFVQSGELEVLIDGQKVAAITSGEPVGEMGLFAQEHRSATVKAVQQCQLGRITREALENLIEEVPGVALRLCQAMSRRLVAANARS